MAFAREEVSLVFERSLGGVLGKGGSLGFSGMWGGVDV